jgi:hypothetical protein
VCRSHTNVLWHVLPPVSDSLTPIWLGTIQLTAEVLCLQPLEGTHNAPEAAVYVQVASEEGLCQLNQQTMTLAEILRSHLQQPHVCFVMHSPICLMPIVR